MGIRLTLLSTGLKVEAELGKKLRPAQVSYLLAFGLLAYVESAYNVQL